MRMIIDSINPTGEARKPWVEPEFDVLNTEDAEISPIPAPGGDGGVYS